MTSESPSVLYLFYDGVAQAGGERTLTLNRLRSLGELGISCLAVTLERTENLESPILASFSQELAKVAPRITFLARRRRALCPGSLVRELRQLCEENPVDLVIISSSQAALIARALKRRPGLPVLWDSHGVMRERWELNTRRSFSRQRMKDYLVLASERVAARVADHVVCVSHAHARRFQKELGLKAERITVVPNYADLGLFSVSEETRLQRRRELGLEDRLVVAYVGNTAAWQCLEETVRVFALIRAKRPEAFFLVLCTEPERIQPILRKHLEEATYSLRKVPHQEVPSYLAAADCALLLRRRSIGNEVASPMKFSEYLACGVPVIIGPAVGDYSAVAREQQVGVILDPDREQTWPETVDALLAMLSIEKSALRERCRSIARQELGWQQQREALASALRRTAEIAHGRERRHARRI